MAVAGRPNPLQRELHRVVLKAHDAAIAAVRAGATAGEVDAAARGVMDVQHWSNKFIHRTGHGLGLAALEDPRLDTGSQRTLEAGLVRTFDPATFIHRCG